MNDSDNDNSTDSTVLSTDSTITDIMLHYNKTVEVIYNTVIKEISFNSELTIGDIQKKVLSIFNIDIYHIQNIELHYTESPYIIIFGNIDYSYSNNIYELLEYSTTIIINIRRQHETNQQINIRKHNTEQYLLYLQVKEDELFAQQLQENYNQSPFITILNNIEANITSELEQFTSPYLNETYSNITHNIIQNTQAIMQQYDHNSLINIPHSNLINILNGLISNDHILSNSNIMEYEQPDNITDLEDIPIVISEIQFNNLDKIIYNHDCDENVCTICLSNYEHTQELIRLDCYHYFHHDCIKHWLTQLNNKCPICRYEIENSLPLHQSNSC
jgi:hypothetical protein